MKKWMVVASLIGVLAGCSKDPAQGAAELCQREVQSRSGNDQGQVDLDELVKGAKPQDGGFQIEAFVYYRKGSPEQRRAPFTCVVGAGGQLQNLAISPFPEPY